MDPSVDLSAESGPRRDDEYWKARPLTAGEHMFTAYANQVLDWSSGRMVVKLRVVDWNKEAKGPGEHHDRPLEWELSRPDLAGRDDDKSKRAYGHWRANIVSAMLAAGYPEDKWPDATPPWWLVLFATLPDRTVVNCIVAVVVKVDKGYEKWPKIVQIKQAEIDGRPIQARLPYCVPEGMAKFHRWGVAEVKTWGKPDGAFGTAMIAVLDPQCVPEGHAGLRTYKDL